MANVQLNSITKIFEKKVEAVKNVSLQIEDKEFLILVGPSGCGKSTLLRMIAGLEEVSSGEIYIDDKIVNEVHPKDRDIAMVFQNYALYPHMTVYENMAFGLKLRKYPKNDIKERVADAAKILDIQNLLDRKPKALSGGQRQRVAVGRAIVRKPKVFLFDEPLSNLDAKLRVQMRIEINKLHKRLQSTMIYVTHDQVEAMTMGDKIVVLKNGEIQQVDTPIELYNNPCNKFVAGFIGSPAMNFFTGTLIKSEKISFLSQLFHFEIKEQLANKLQNYNHEKIIIGIRPEDFILSNSQNLQDSGLSQKIQVDVVEPVGNEMFLYFSDEEQSYCLRTPSIQNYQIGEQIELHFDFNKLHFFDIQTEQKII